MAMRQPKILIVTHLIPNSFHDHHSTLALYDFFKFWPSLSSLLILKTKQLSKRALLISPTSAMPRFRRLGKVRIVTFPIIGDDRLVPIVLFGLIYSFLMLLIGFWPRIVVSHCKPNHRIAKFFGRTFNAPHGMAIHASDTIRYDPVVAAVASRCSMLVFRSRSIREHFWMRYPAVRWRPEFTANSGIPAEDVVEPAIAIALKRNNPMPVYCTVSSLIPLKNIDANLRVFAKLPHNGWEYRVIGDGPERGQLERLATQLGVSSNVTFYGRRERREVYSLLDQSDFFVMVSAPETFGLAYLEAMARGCLVIAAAGWGVDGIVTHSQNGFLCRPGDEQQLESIILETLHMSQEARAQMIVKSIDSVRELEGRNVARAYYDALLAIV